LYSNSSLADNDFFRVLCFHLVMKNSNSSLADNDKSLISFLYARAELFKFLIGR